MYRNVTPDYYGYRDEDDGTVLLKEAEAEGKGAAPECSQPRTAPPPCNHSRVGA